MANPDLFELLANLDFLVEGPKTRSLQDENYTQYKHDILFRIADALGNQYTVNQIKDQLWQEFQSRERYPEYVFDMLFLHGSSTMDLDIQARIHIQKHLEGIRKKYAEDKRQFPQTRSVTLAPMSRQRRLLSSPSTRSLSSSQTGNCRPNAVRKTKNPTQKRLCKTGLSRSTIPKTHKLQPLVIVPSIEIDETPYHSTTSISSTMNFVRTPSSLSGRIADGARSVSHDVRSNDSAISQTSQPAIKNRWSPAAFSEVHHLEMAAELRYYQRRCKLAEHDCEIMKKERRQMESFKDIPKDTTLALRQNIRQISNLKEQLGDRANLERYLSIDNFQRVASNSHRLTSYFHTLKDQLPSIRVRNGAYEPPIKPLKGRSVDLDELLLTIFGKSVLGEPERIPDAFPALNLYELIQALTGAAIHCWIFGSEYRTHAMAMTPLLQKYCDHIATLCGNESLYDLDMAVHRSMIEEDRFKDVILPTMSNMFTTRLLDALQPLFEQKARRNTIKMLRQSLDSIILLAVQIRTESLVSTEDYDSIWPLIGSLFDSDEMETKHAGPVAISNAVRLPICPGLRAYTKEKAMVGYSSLIKDGMSHLTPEYVVKALILR